MYQNISIKMLNLILSLSDALDLASPELSQHQLRTAFIAWEMSKAACLPPAEIDQLFVAALLHDIGALSVEDKINIHKHDVVDTGPHCILGERLLTRTPIFESSSKIVRYHHKKWEAWEGENRESYIFYSQILLLADTLERSIDRKTYILHQHQDLVDMINSLAGTVIDPSVIEMFKAVAGREDFWLDLVSQRLYSIILHQGPNRGIELELSFLTEISNLFRLIIDFRSRFTATHSSGVAASASTISRLLGLTETETALMGIAGNLHDLGKMVIPNAILVKPGKLTREEFAIMMQHTYFTYTVLNTIEGISQISEWAAFHHERLDGSGYPFHLGADKLSIGSRIMAVADVFTALAEDRPYRKGMAQSEVLSVLSEMASKSFIDKIVLRILQENYDEVLTLTRKKQAEALDYYQQFSLI